MEAARTDWKDIALRSKQKLAKTYEDNREQIRYAADTVEVFLAGGIIGWIHGRNGGIPKRLGIPLDLGLMILFKGLGFYMSAKGWTGAADVHAIGNGIGGYYFGTMGLEIGQKQLAAATDKDGKKTALGHPLSDKEASDANIDRRTNTILAGEEQQRTAIGEGNRSYQVTREQRPQQRIFR